MLTKLWGKTFFRNFSKSVVWRNVEKKPTEVPTTSSSSQDFVISKMPSKLEKKILLYSGKFKTEEEIPKRITSETLDNAMSKVRIKVANILIILILIACGGIILMGKIERKEKISKWEKQEAARRAERELKEAAQAK